MPRNITITFDDGTSHQYNGAPDDITPEQVQQRATQEFKKNITNIDGGRNTTSQKTLATQEGANANPVLQGVLNVGQGLSLGFGDELAGVGSGAISALKGEGYDKGYNEGADYVRGAVEKHQKDYPIGSAVGQIAGSIPLGVLGMGVKAKTPWEGIKQAAKVGGAIGGIEGTGNENSTDIQKRLVAGLKAVPLGATAGAVLSGVGSLAGKGYRAGMDALTGNRNDVIANTALMRVINKDNPIPEGFGASKLESNEIGSRNVAKNLQDLGKEATIADASGQNAIEKLRQLSEGSGKAKDLVKALITNRKEQRAGRITGVTDQAINPKGAKFYKSIEDYNLSKREESQPFYTQLESVKFPIDDEIRSLLSRSQASHKDINKMLQVEGKDLINFEDLMQKNNPTFTTKEGAVVNLIGEGKDAKYILGNVDITKAVNSGRTTLLKNEGDLKEIPFTNLNEIKTSIGELGNIATTAGKTNYGAKLQNLRNDLNNKLDLISPKDKIGSIYKQASNIWEKGSKLESSIKAGREISSQKSIDIAEIMKKLSIPELEAYRIGASQSLRETLGGKEGVEPLLGIKGKLELEDKYKLILGDKYDQFLKTLQNENKLKELESIKPKNITEKEFADEGINPGMVGSLTQTGLRSLFNRMPYVATLARIATDKYNNFIAPEASRDALAKMLTLKGDEATFALRGVTSISKKYADALEKYESLNANLTGLAGGQIAGKRKEQQR